MNNKNFYYSLLSKRYPKIRELVAKRLNDKGLTTKRGNKYNFAVVNNVFAGLYVDQNIEDELALLAKEAGYDEQQIQSLEKLAI